MGGATSGRQGRMIEPSCRVAQTGGEILWLQVGIRRPSAGDGSLSRAFIPPRSPLPPLIAALQPASATPPTHDRAPILHSTGRDAVFRGGWEFHYFLEGVLRCARISTCGRSLRR